MKHPHLMFLAMALLLLIIPPSEAHRSGCHRWHSCPSDSGSYVCGDWGYCSSCPDNQYCSGGNPIIKTASSNLGTTPSASAPVAEPMQSPQISESSSSTSYSSISAPAIPTVAASCDIQACAAKTTSYCIGEYNVTHPYSCKGSICTTDPAKWEVNDVCWREFCARLNREWDGSNCKAKCYSFWYAESDWSQCVSGTQERMMSDGCGNEEKQTQKCSAECKGTALCYSGTITSISNGDTLIIDGQKVQLALVDAPEFYQWGYGKAKQFTANLCKKGSTAIVDQDDLQPKDKYGRIVAVVYCHGKNLNKELLLNN